MAPPKRGGKAPRGRSRYFDKNTLQTQKPHAGKHGDRGYEGPDRRIGRLEPETLGYYRRVEQQLKDGFEEEEEKCLFLNNVFTQVEEEIHLLACNQTVSRILETLLHHASTCHLINIISHLKQNNFTSLCTDRFAGYVLQTIVCLIPTHLSGNSASKGVTTQEKTTEKEELDSLRDLFLEVCEEMVQGIAPLVRDHYGSHVLRAVFETLSGVKLEQKMVRSRLSLGQQNKGKESKAPSTVTVKPPPPSFLQMLQQFTKAVLDIEDFSGLVSHVAASPLLQALLTVLHKVDQGLCTQVCQQVMESGVFTRTCAESELSGVCLALVHQHASYIVKTLLTVADDTTYRDLFQRHFMWRLVPLSLHPVATFGLQQLLATLRTEDQLTSVLDEVMPHFEDLLAHGKAMVLINLADACVRHRTGQRRFTKKLLKAFHIPKNDRLRFVQVVASLQSYELFTGVPEDSSEEQQKTAKVLTTVTLQGSLLLQYLLKFDDPSDVVDSLEAMSAQELQTLACNSFGSRVLETFLTSPTVSEKRRKPLLQKMMDLYVGLSCDKFGSRVMDVVWKVAPVGVKASIAEKLVEKEDRVRSDQYGRYVWQNCAIDHFTKHKEKWKDVQSAQEKKRKLFQEILAEESPPKKPKKERKETADPKPADQLAPELAILGVGVDQEEEEDEESDSADSVTCVSLCSKDTPHLQKTKNKDKLKKEVQDSDWEDDNKMDTKPKKKNVDTGRLEEDKLKIDTKPKKKIKKNVDTDRLEQDKLKIDAKPKKKRKKNIDTDRSEHNKMKNTQAAVSDPPSSEKKAKKKVKLQEKKKRKKFPKIHPKQQ
ncbi:nucleolar protein 9-like isoform X1 [Branchiostoma floridae]|uniref:Nucleolar protein 9-like isoform X1 n=1 Tax=Branchiostoma floridae TaxID=7739 RepID=A0A9J7MTK4_BRAFL|nr:nucleolar protein 9-like isoform X1 [Branchiostoma floridae]